MLKSRHLGFKMAAEPIVVYNTQPKRLQLEIPNLVTLYIIICMLLKYYMMYPKTPSWIQNGGPKNPFSTLFELEIRNLA